MNNVTRLKPKPLSGAERQARYKEKQKLRKLALNQHPIASPLTQLTPVTPSPEVCATMAQIRTISHDKWATKALAYTSAIGLTGVAAYFSIKGMVVLFPGQPEAIVGMGVAMECSKLVGVAFLSSHWGQLGFSARSVLLVLVLGLAAINAAGVYSQLVQAHLGDRATTMASTEVAAAKANAELSNQIQLVADLSSRIGQLDGVVEEMTRRGRTNSAQDTIATQRKVREQLVSERKHEAEKLVSLKESQASATSRAHQVEVETAPIRFVAQLFGVESDQAIRLLILLMVLCCDPMAIALTAAASIRCAYGEGI